jgi:uncharacterized protein involved in exopolysaccharide biosynthesis
MSDLGAEREIDLGRWKQAAVDRWWVIAAGLVAGAVIGALYSLTGGSLYQASVLISPGQAFSPSGAPVQNYYSSPRGINDIVTLGSTLEAAAKEAHVSVSQLRGHVTTSTVLTGSGSTASRGTVLIQIIVQLPKVKKAEAAAEALRTIVLTATTSKYVTQSVDVLQTEITSYGTELSALSDSIKTLNAAVASETDATQKAILAIQADSAAQRFATISTDLATARQQLALAKSVEYPTPIGGVSAVKSTARSRRNSILVGALIGLIAGAIVAIVVDVRARRARPA